MSTTTAQVQFAAEFVTLMVSAAGLSLALLRSEPAWAHVKRSRAAALASASRLLAVVAFLVAGTTAFLSGSLLVTTDPRGALGIARVVSAALLAASVAGWSGGRRSRLLFLVGAVGWAAAGLAQLSDASVAVIDAFLAAGSLATGLALVSSSRRSIAAKVAAGAATTLLLVVLVVAVALSQVISSSLEHNELDHLAQQSQTYAGEVFVSLELASSDASLVAGGLQGSFSQVSPNPLYVLRTPSGAGSKAAASAVEARLAALSQLSPASLFYASPAGLFLPGAGATRPVNETVAAALAGSSQLPATQCSSRVAYVPVGGVVWATAAFPVCSTAPTPSALGRLFAAFPVDGTFLRGLNPASGLSLALMSQSAVVASTPGFAVHRSALPKLVGPNGTTRQTGNQFVAVAPITPSPGLTLATATPGASVFSTRHQLYRTLFLIALGGTILALGFSIFIGDRITVGIRRLTSVAADIQAGDTQERAEITGDDEVSVLGSAFDSMLDSLEAQTNALQAAADDETRLRNRLEAVVGGMNDALIAVDSSGRITDFNRAAELLLGVTSEAALRKPVDRVVYVVDDSGEPFAKKLGKPTPSPWGRLGVVRSADDVPVPVAISAGALRGPLGEVTGSVVVMRDLRREREVEQMKTEFLSRVGHELRTPLTGIMGYADILLRRDIPAERAHVWYEEILQSGRRLLRIVELLEFFASSGAGRVLLRPESVDTKALVRGITSSWSERLPPNVTIGRHVSPRTPPVLADRRWLGLAIEELIDNAVKFSPEGGRVLVSAGPVPEPSNGRAGGVQISVVDRGIGMTSSEHAALFGEFVQADGSDTRRFGGLGLGLAVVQRVVEGHGGSVDCRTTPGRGTTFTIYLPGAGTDGGR